MQAIGGDRTSALEFESVTVLSRVFQALVVYVAETKRAQLGVHRQKSGPPPVEKRTCRTGRAQKRTGQKRCETR